MLDTVFFPAMSLQFIHDSKRVCFRLASDFVDGVDRLSDYGPTQAVINTVACVKEIYPERGRTKLVTKPEPRLNDDQMLRYTLLIACKVFMLFHEIPK